MYNKLLNRIALSLKKALNLDNVLLGAFHFVESFIQLFLQKHFLYPHYRFIIELNQFTILALNCVLLSYIHFQHPCRNHKFSPKSQI
jgi:hypothetical protein